MPRDHCGWFGAARRIQRVRDALSHGLGHHATSALCYATTILEQLFV